MDSELSPMPELAAPRIGVRAGGAEELGNRRADWRSGGLAGGQAGGASLHYISGRPRDTSPTVEDMGGIILEGVLFVALLATVAALLFYALVRWTPLGLRLRQDANRRKIEQTLELDCPIHGPQREEEMVRLPSGSRICPTCYKEALHE
jgi:hypothetical protein